MEKKYSLKDVLFNENKVTKIALEIQQTYPDFDTKKFIKNTLGTFPSLELKQRITWIADTLKYCLPDNYQQAVLILLKSLPPPNSRTNTDNDFGDFIYAPYAEFVAKFGCNKEHLFFSLNALKEITMRFSAEDAIRYFINAFPDETMGELLKWSEDSHYHVRRLASEGTRPKLPWSQKIILSYPKTIPILDNLFSDSTRYVTRSVANHVNDISKIDPELALSTLKRWQQLNKQNPKEMEYIINHALRTLMKQGYKNAIVFLKFSPQPNIEITKFQIHDPVNLGSSLEFDFLIHAHQDEILMIDYVLRFPNKNGTGHNKKVFKLKKVTLKKGQQIFVHKKQILVKQMTTRTLYPGEYTLQIQVNGMIFMTRNFIVR